MKPIDLIGLLAPAENTISVVVSDSPHSGYNTEMTVEWIASAFGGQSDVDTVRIYVTPNDGSCHADGASYCVISVDATSSGHHVLTDLIPGRGYILDASKQFAPFFELLILSSWLFIRFLVHLIVDSFSDDLY